jgi:hypothetical protein
MLKLGSFALQLQMGLYCTRSCYAALLVCSMRATCPTHFIVTDLIVIIRAEECKLRESTLCDISQPPVTSSVLGPYNFLSSVL